MLRNKKTYLTGREARNKPTTLRSGLLTAVAHQVEAAVTTKSNTEFEWNTTRSDLVAELNTAHEDQEALSHARDKLARAQRDAEQTATQKSGLDTALAVANDRTTQANKILTKAQETVKKIESELQSDDGSNVGMIKKLKQANTEAATAEEELTKAMNAQKVAFSCVRMLVFDGVCGRLRRTL